MKKLCLFTLLISLLGVCSVQGQDSQGSAQVNSVVSYSGEFNFQLNRQFQAGTGDSGLDTLLLNMNRGAVGKIQLSRSEDC